MHRANVTAERAVSSVRDTAYPKFFQYLDKCATANQKLAAISHSQCPQLIKLIQKLPWLVVIMWQLLGLYFLPGINTEHTRPEIY
jgi:magnesium-protoporphyrin IX monomethyl ester (oxidative) cyclase